MSDEIIKILDALAEKFGVVVDWTSTNVIPYIEQLFNKYINYEITTSIVWLLLGIGFLFLGKILFKKSKQCYEKVKNTKINNIKYDYIGYCILLGICCGITVIIGLIITMTQIFDIVTCFTFPEKIIIDEIKSIYKSM